MKERLNLFITKQISAAYRAGYKMCLQDRGELPKYISRNKADSIYGREVIQKLVNTGLIEIIKDGKSRTSRCRIDREQLMIAVAANNIAAKPNP